MFTKILKVPASFAAIFIPVFLNAAKTTEPHTVDFPWINYSNTTLIDITSVELNDSSTVLHINAHFIPHNWIKFVGDTYLRADGKKYMMTSTIGIEPDKEFWMPDSGEADFKLVFEPLPFSTQRFDLIEGDAPDSFKLWDIDLTGTPSPEYPYGLPDEYKRDLIDGAVPEPSFTMGKTTINFHILPYYPEFGSELNLFVNVMNGIQDSYPVKFDSDGNGTISFDQYGSAEAFIADRQTGMLYGNGELTLMPGETIDCYLDPRYSGVKAMSHREKKPTNLYRKSFHNGAYRNFDMMRSNISKIYRLNLHSGDFADYHMTGKQYMDLVKSEYLSLYDSIQSADIPYMQKEYSLLTLQNDVLEAIADYRDILALNYRHCNMPDDWRTPVPADSIRAELSPVDFAEVITWFDTANPRLLMADSNLKFHNWNAWGSPGDLSKSVNMFYEMSKRASNMNLQPSDIDSLRTLSNPFFAEACDSIYNRAVKECQLLSQKAQIADTPDVPNDDLFDAIIAPHKGKVVVVDLWNTWCMPCRHALKTIEPLKSRELSDEDIVWIYIADESSSHPKYLSMISEIKGIHYKVSQEQIQAIRQKFNVDGIPYYILVDRQGKTAGRPDMRDHGIFIETIKSKL